MQPALLRRKNHDCMITFRTVACIYALEQFQRKCHIFKLHVPQPYLIAIASLLVPWVFVIKAFGFVRGYNGSARAVGIYHIKNPCTKKGVVWYFRDIRICFINNTYLCTSVLWLSLIILQYCLFSPRGFYCGTSQADPQTLPLRVQEQPDERGWGARSPIKPQSHCDIKHCRELPTEHQCLVECFVYNLIQ